MLRRLIIIGLLALAGCGHTRDDQPPLQTVPHVDLQRYLGTWYEIASYPQWFQRGCTGTSATYALRRDGEIDVLNRCHKESLDGNEDTAKGRARVVDPASNAKLRVSFFWPFWGDYWIIDQGEHYEYAVVGNPNRAYLWILARQPHMDAAVYAGIVARLKAQGYDPQRLQKTVQP
jgi:apolipoprotein D and lipocalin family protein